MKVGHGTAHGAVTILNATATGIGCALAIEQGATAAWTRGRGAAVALKPPGDERLLKAVAEVCADLLHGRGGTVEATCAMPPSRGLKTSSSVAAALVRAAAATGEQTLGDVEVERRAVAACRKAGITLTGAYDDQAAVVRGGAHLTDNHGDAVLLSVPIEPWHVAVWVPDASISKPRIVALDVTALRPACEAAADLVRDGRLAEAMTANGRAFHAAYAAAGLPVDDAPTQAALAAGALGAGLSGTGPAVAALFAAPADLPAVRGGAWRWSRAVPQP